MYLLVWKNDYNDFYCFEDYRELYSYEEASRIAFKLKSKFPSKEIYLAGLSFKITPATQYVVSACSTQG